MIKRLAALAALLALGAADAQTATHGYPSLAKRPIESREKTAQPAGPEAAPGPVSDPVAESQAARFAAEGATGVAEFDKNLNRVTAKVAAAAAASPGSEAWSQAQIEISGLDAARYESVVALANLDTLYVAKITSAGVVAPLVETTRTMLASAVDRQNDALDRLRARLAQP